MKFFIRCKLGQYKLTKKLDMLFAKEEVGYAW